MNSKNKKKILIVDDEKWVCDRLSSYFKRKGFLTEVAYNGKEALRCIQRKRPDVVILDILMPEMDGLRVLKYLKYNRCFSGLPVIMLTQKKECKDLNKGIELGADFYLPKPFRLSNLMGFIQTAVGELSI